MRHFVTIVFLFLAYITSAQIDKDYFDSVIEEEFSESNYQQRTNHSGTYVHTVPQSVPLWFINPPIAEGNEVYAIGISDPDLDSTQAYEQALYRARIMACILYHGTTQLLCDFFFNEIQNSQDIIYEHFSRINAKVPNNEEFNVIETFQNNFDETMVLIKCSPKVGIMSSEHNKVKLELYSNEIEVSKKSEYQSIYEMLVHKGTDKSDTVNFYQLTEFGKRYDVIRYSGNKLVQVPIYTLKYSGIPSSDSTNIQYFSHGLWKEYMRSVMNEIIGVARLKPENIQSLGETYQYENNEKLIRGISVNKMRFVITGISVIRAELKVNLREIPLSGY